MWWSLAILGACLLAPVGFLHGAEPGARPKEKGGKPAAQAKKSRKPAKRSRKPAKKSPKPAKKQSVESAVRAAAAGLVGLFDEGSPEAFFRRVDGDSFPNYVDFREAVRDFLLHNRQINTKIVIDHVLHAGDKAAVQFKWLQSYLDEAGQRQNDTGRCEFILRRLASGEWVLTAVHGSSPFS